MQKRMQIKHAGYIVALPASAFCTFRKNEVKPEIWRNSAATATFEGAGNGVVQVRVMGPISPGTMSEFRREMLSRIAAPGSASGWVIDLRLAVLMFTEESIHLAFRQSDTDSGMIPLAIVVNPSHELVGQRWALEMAYAGLLRGSFIDSEEAHDWVLSRIECQTVT